ncbi:MAG: phosphoribosyl-ATP diphosphatase [Pseudomonadota bacterium]
MPDDTLRRLAETIRTRRAETATKSYTRSLLDAGTEKCAQKMGEEAVETVIAAVSGDSEHLRAEAADLLYHLLVLLEQTGVDLDEVLMDLEGRMGKSGHEEKAARGQSDAP